MFHLFRRDNGCTKIEYTSHETWVYSKINANHQPLSTVESEQLTSFANWTKQRILDGAYMDGAEKLMFEMDRKADGKLPALHIDMYVRREKGE